MRCRAWAATPRSSLFYLYLPLPNFKKQQKWSWRRPSRPLSFTVRAAAHRACRHQIVHREYPGTGAAGSAPWPCSDGPPICSAFGRSIGYEPSRPTGRRVPKGEKNKTQKNVEGNKTRTGGKIPKEGRNSHRMGCKNTQKGNLKPQTRPGVRQDSSRNGRMSGDKEGGDSYCIMLVG